MKLLALDLGTTTGWAMSSINPHGKRQIQSGSQSFKPRRFDGGGMRYLRMQSWLGEMEKLLGGIDMLAFEEVQQHGRANGTAAAHAYGGFLATLTMWCEQNSVPYQGVPVGVIKKYWTGKGNSGKDIMLRIAKERGFKPADDNEADALALLHWMIDETARSADQRPAPDGEARRLLPVGLVQMAAKGHIRR